MKDSKNKKCWILIGVLVIIVLIGLGYWKRIGIRNTFYRVAGIEIPVTKKGAERAKAEQEPEEAHGYYKTVVDVEVDVDETVLVSENDEAVNGIQATVPSEKTLVQATYQIDQQVEAELDSGNYSWDAPMVILNPYKISPLTGVVLFKTEESCGVRVTVKGNTESTDISGELEPSTVHRIPVIGLYPDKENTVILELLDEEGKVTDSQELKVKTDGVPEKLNDVIRPVITSGKSAYGLTMVYGQKTPLPFAYDSAGDIRWYFEKETSGHGLYNLSDNRLILEDNGAYTPTQERPQPTNLYEIDYLGRAYQMYYIANGSHHEVIEKEPGGNLLVLSSSLKGHIEEKILEVDRKSGDIVSSLELEDIFGETYVDMVDWAHTNTVSYNAKDDTILISNRNLHSVMKINWTTHELVWILCNPEFWKDTDFEQYVLQPTEEFDWHYHQHSSYEIEADLDGNPDTIQVSVFDNHWQNFRKVNFFDGRNDSYATVYAVNEKEMTVGLLKQLSVAKSKITSNTVYDEGSNHIFAMCGLVVNAEDGRKGMNYEFDYDTGVILNQYSIKTKFYRATEMKIDYQDLASAMVIEKNYIKGTLRPPVKIGEAVEAPKEILAEGLEFKMVGSVLYVKAKDHRISQMIFKGKEHTYVYDSTSIKQTRKGYLVFEAFIPIPLQNMEPDSYEILCVYEDVFYNTGESIQLVKQ